MNHQIKKLFPYSLFLLPISFALAEIAAADLLVEPGQHAMLTVNVTIEGTVEKPQGHRDEVVKWSTKRSFDAKVEMVAGKAETMSVSESFSGPSDSKRAELEDVQKQAKACGADQMCQMQVAMKFMNSSAVKGAADAPPRYQSWRAVEKGGAPVDASASYTESLHTVFYTAARETTDCTMTAPKVSPELLKMDPTSGEKWAALNKEALDGSARSFVVEVDSVEKIGMLNILSPLSIGSGSIECVQNIGSGPETSQHSKGEMILTGEEMKIPLKASGTAAGSDVIASGSNSFKAHEKLNNLGVGFAVDVKAPLDVTIRWELKKL